MLAGHEIIAYWAGREACGLVSLLIMSELWLGKNRSKWFVMRGEKGNMCFCIFVDHGGVLMGK